ncbi:MAG: hypothetical protein Q8K98_03485 [Bacteroidota bacterium]|nr:hypothetical protein [Bacteroidota bacterium]
MSLINLIDPDRDRSKFTSKQNSQAMKLEQAMRVQELPTGFSPDDVHIRREPKSGMVYISNKAQQMCMLNECRLEIYYRCPKCRNDGFKNTLYHGPKCDEIIW